MSFKFKHTVVYPFRWRWGWPPYQRPLYRLDELMRYSTGIEGHDVEYGPIHLGVSGILTIQPGYLFDGATGGWDFRFDGCLPHDAGCLLVNKGLLPSKYQVVFDELMRETNIKDGGMIRPRAWGNWLFVRGFQSVNRQRQRWQGQVK